MVVNEKKVYLAFGINIYSRNDIVVFLEPLVDNLHTLFETGVDTYDVSKKYNFNLRAVVLLTINDYPALGTLCGCPYSGFKGCVVYGKDTNCVRLSASSKQSYVGHRRYLPYNHPFRKQKKAFNGQQEFLSALIPMINIQRVGTLLHVLGKTKDEVNARLDLAKLGVKPELFAMQEEDKTTLPPVGYTLTNAEKDTFCETKHNIRVIKGHVRNRNKPEGCIAEETIAEETIKFFSEYHKSMETIGILPDKHETDENEEGKPLSADKSSEVFAELFQKAHLYVI
ncbi:retrovirus-related pol polyprotein from transposon TNT 1-94 [Tanacetum coccineum]